MIEKRKIQFSLGRVVASPGSLEALQTANQSPSEFLDRHVSGDWGDLCEEDREANELALKNGDRILSSYHLNDDTKIWIITEADRSAPTITTILLPEEY